MLRSLNTVLYIFPCLIAVDRKSLWWERLSSLSRSISKIPWTAIWTTNFTQNKNGLYENSFHQKFYGRFLVVESFSNKSGGLVLQFSTTKANHGCFPVNFVKFIRIAFFIRSPMDQSFPLHGFQFHLISFKSISCRSSKKPSKFTKRTAHQKQRKWSLTVESISQKHPSL